MYDYKSAPKSTELMNMMIAFPGLNCEICHSWLYKTETIQMYLITRACKSRQLSLSWESLEEVKEIWNIGRIQRIVDKLRWRNHLRGNAGDLWKLRVAEGFSSKEEKTSDIQPLGPVFCQQSEWTWKQILPGSR